MTLNLIITEDDIKSSIKLKEKECIKLTSDEMFRGIIYTMLSIKEKYIRQIIMYNQLLRQGLDTPLAILEKPEVASKIASGGLNKDKHIINLAEWWLKSNIAEDIIADVNTGRSEEFNIRNRIAKDKDASGLMYKGASLFLNMCGYKNVVAIDTWTLRALVAEDYKIKPYYYKPENGKKHPNHNYIGKGMFMDRGITACREYTLYEQFFWDLTEKFNSKYNYNFTPFDFRQILWVKRSTWGKEFGNEPNQLELLFKC